MQQQVTVKQLSDLCRGKKEKHYNSVGPFLKWFNSETDDREVEKKLREDYETAKRIARFADVHFRGAIHRFNSQNNANPQTLTEIFKEVTKQTCENDAWDVIGALEKNTTARKKGQSRNDFIRHRVKLRKWQAEPIDPEHLAELYRNTQTARKSADAAASRDDNTPNDNAEKEVLRAKLSYRFGLWKFNSQHYNHAPCGGLTKFSSFGFAKHMAEEDLKVICGDIASNYCKRFIPENYKARAEQ